ncbi:MAG: hypothetical protein ACKVHP_00285 [Verrucomicrobiales bacterium]
MVEFYVAASDGLRTRTWPAPTNTGQNANAHYQVDNEAHDESTPFYHLLMKLPDEAGYAAFDLNSNAQVNTTFIAFDGTETKIRYRCGTRIRGKSSRFGTPRPMRLSIPRDRSWNGITELNLNQSCSYLQILGQKLFQASDLPSVKA